MEKFQGTNINIFAKDRMIINFYLDLGSSMAQCNNSLFKF